MAEINGFGIFRHLRADASSHVLLFRNSKLRRSGAGLSFWFSPFAASLAELPMDDREVALAVHGRSADFQDVTVSGNLTYRIADPALAAARVDFSIDPRHGRHLRQPLEKLSLVMHQLVEKRAIAYLRQVPLREAVVHGHEGIRSAVLEEVLGSTLLTELGLVLVAVHVASVKPSADVERALEAPTRERIQEEADEATFRRRAQAVDKERAIQENELNNQIELARREQELIEQRGQNARREATEKAEANRIDAEGQAERTRVAGEAEAVSIRAVRGARMATERERLEIYRTMPAAPLAALAARDLAGKLPHIDHLTIAPDALASMFAGFLDAGTRRLRVEEEPR